MEQRKNGRREKQRSGDENRQRERRDRRQVPENAERGGKVRKKRPASRGGTRDEKTRLAAGSETVRKGGKNTEGAERGARRAEKTRNAIWRKTGQQRRPGRSDNPGSWSAHGPRGWARTCFIVLRSGEPASKKWWGHSVETRRSRARPDEIRDGAESDRERG